MAPRSVESGTMESAQIQYDYRLPNPIWHAVLGVGGRKIKSRLPAGGAFLGFVFC